MTVISEGGSVEGGVREDFFFFKGGEKKRNKGKILAQNRATLAHTDRSLGTESTHLKTKTKQTEEKRRKQTSYLNKFFLLLVCFLELCLLLLLQPLQSLFNGLGWWHLEGNINHFRCTSPHAVPTGTSTTFGVRHHMHVPTVISTTLGVRHHIHVPTGTSTTLVICHHMHAPTGRSQSMTEWSFFIYSAILCYQSDLLCSSCLWPPTPTSKTLILKDSSIGSIWTCWTASPCYYDFASDL